MSDSVLRCLTLNVDTLSDGKAKLLLEWNECQTPKPYDVLLIQETNAVTLKDPVNWILRKKQLEGKKDLITLFKLPGFLPGEFENYKCYSSCRETFTNFQASGGVAIFVRENWCLGSRPCSGMSKADFDFYKRMADRIMIRWDRSEVRINYDKDNYFTARSPGPSQWGGSGVAACCVTLREQAYLFVSVYRHKTTFGSELQKIEDEELRRHLDVLLSNEATPLRPAPLPILAGDFNFKKEEEREKPPWKEFLADKKVLNNEPTHGANGANEANSVLDLVIVQRSLEAQYRLSRRPNSCEWRVPQPKKVGTTTNMFGKKAHKYGVHFELKATDRAPAQEQGPDVAGPSSRPVDLPPAQDAAPGPHNASTPSSSPAGGTATASWREPSDDTPPPPPVDSDAAKATEPATEDDDEVVEAVKAEFDQLGKGSLGQSSKK